MSALSLLLALTVTATPATEVKTLAMPALTSVGLTPEFTRFASEHFAQQLTQRGLKVTTDREIATIIGLERQKQLLGCSDESSSCIAELAGALGVDALVLGDIGKFDGVYRVNLKIVSASTSEKLAARSFKAETENDVLDQLGEAAKYFAATLRPGASAAFGIEGGVSRHPYRGMAWIPAVAGVALAGFGTYEALQAKQAHDELVAGRVTGATEGQARADGGSNAQLLSGIAFGAAGLSFAAAATMFVLTGEDSPATVSLTPGGAQLMFAGEF